jgi:hypothetical protein
MDKAYKVAITRLGIGSGSGVAGRESTGTRMTSRRIASANLIVTSGPT